MSKTKVGRKPKYTKDLLVSKLNDYVDKNPHKKIKLSELTRATDIPRYV